MAYPVSDELKDEWAQARATLERDHRLNGAYWMPPEHLHVTIATLISERYRAQAERLNPADREVTLDEWRTHPGRRQNFSGLAAARAVFGSNWASRRDYLVRGGCSVRRTSATRTGPSRR